MSGSGIVWAPGAVSGGPLPRRPLGRDGGALAGAILLGALSVVCILLIQPRLGIVDVDGVAYIMGARDLRMGLGYRSLAGEPFNTWPPGYSLILSLFSDQTGAALAVNYVSFGATVGLLYFLLRRSGWSWPAAAGLTLALGSGFFRLKACVAHADSLTYALFLAALGLATAGRDRTLPAMLWALLTPVKFVAVAFLPPAIFADFMAAPKDLWGLTRRYALGATVTVATTGAVLIYNWMTIGTWMAASHPNPSIHELFAGAKAFLFSIPREFLFGWRGSAHGIFPELAFGLTMALVGICAVSLRPVSEGRWLRLYGVAFLACCVILLCVREFDPSVRLTAYGLMSIMLGLRPLRWADWAWAFYGLAALATALVNGLGANDLGSNDPRYARLAAEVRSAYKGKAVVASNSFYILDLHANVASAPVHDYTAASPYKEFLWVTLPNYDAAASAITPMPAPTAGWCEESRFPGAVLYRRCSKS